jgi:hypothetical protein
MKKYAVAVDVSPLSINLKYGIVAPGRAAYSASSVLLLLGRSSGADFNAARHLTRMFHKPIA